MKRILIVLVVIAVSFALQEESFAVYKTTFMPTPQEKTRWQKSLDRIRKQLKRGPDKLMSPGMEECTPFQREAAALFVSMVSQFERKLRQHQKGLIEFPEKELNWIIPLMDILVDTTSDKCARDLRKKIELKMHQFVEMFGKFIGEIP